VFIVAHGMRTWHPIAMPGPAAFVKHHDLRQAAHVASAAARHEELCAPLGISDCYLGIPDVVIPPCGHTARRCRGDCGDSLLDGMGPADSPPQAIGGAVMNRPDMRRASLPFAGGITNARAIARHYALLARHGELDGVRLLSPARVEEMRALQEFEPGAVPDGKLHKGLGYMLLTSIAGALLAHEHLPQHELLDLP
jgi:CubicO group peptidase (beta-lactamase class C family)